MASPEETEHCFNTGMLHSLLPSLQRFTPTAVREGGAELTQLPAGWLFNILLSSSPVALWEELFSCVKAFMQIQAFQGTNVGKAVGNFGMDVMERSCGCNRKCLYWRKQDEGWGHRKEKLLGSGKVYWRKITQPLDANCIMNHMHFQLSFSRAPCSMGSVVFQWGDLWAQLGGLGLNVPKLIYFTSPYLLETSVRGELWEGIAMGFLLMIKWWSDGN